MKADSFAVWLVATVFIFCSVHGAFVRKLWSLLRMKAKKSTDERQKIQIAGPHKKPVCKRTGAPAYVNPFLNILK